VSCVAPGRREPIEPTPRGGAIGRGAVIDDASDPRVAPASFVAARAFLFSRSSFRLRKSATMGNAEKTPAMTVVGVKMCFGGG